MHPHGIDAPSADRASASAYPVIAAAAYPQTGAPPDRRPSGADDARRAPNAEAMREP
jgi:hypothetical protein